MADENVAAKHGEQTTNFLLVLANIVSTINMNVLLLVSFYRFTVLQKSNS